MLLRVSEFYQIWTTRKTFLKNQSVGVRRNKIGLGGRCLTYATSSHANIFTAAPNRNQPLVHKWVMGQISSSSFLTDMHQHLTFLFVFCHVSIHCVVQQFAGKERRKISPMLFLWWWTGEAFPYFFDCLNWPYQPLFSTLLNLMDLYCHPLPSLPRLLSL